MNEEKKICEPMQHSLVRRSFMVCELCNEILGKVPSAPEGEDPSLPPRESLPRHSPPSPGKALTEEEAYALREEAKKKREIPQAGDPKKHFISKCCGMQFLKGSEMQDGSTEVICSKCKKRYKYIPGSPGEPGGMKLL